MAARPATTPPGRRLDVAIYNQIVASGALEGQHVELLDGAIVEMSPQSPAHAAVVEMLTQHLAGTLSRLRVQLPLEVAPDSAPEPDLALVDEPATLTRHPRTALLVIEVSVNSHPIDRDAKARIYARAGIPTYWLIDVPAQRVEVRTDPNELGYATVVVHRQSETVPCPLDGVPDLDFGRLLTDM